MANRNGHNGNGATGSHFTYRRNFSEASRTFGLGFLRGGELIELSGGGQVDEVRAASITDTGENRSHWGYSLECGCCYLGIQHTEAYCKLEREAYALRLAQRVAR